MIKIELSKGECEVIRYLIDLHIVFGAKQFECVSDFKFMNTEVFNILDKINNPNANMQNSTIEATIIEESCADTCDNDIYHMYSTMKEIRESMAVQASKQPLCLVPANDAYLFRVGWLDLNSLTVWEIDIADLKLEKNMTLCKIQDIFTNPEIAAGTAKSLEKQANEEGKI